MAQIPNVTGKIAELRENKHAKSLTRSTLPHPSSKRTSPKQIKRKPPMTSERKIASNPVVLIVYSGVFVGLLAQLILISLLDLL